MATRKVEIILTAVDKTKRAFASANRSLKAFGASFSRVASQLGLAFGVGAGGVVAGVKALANEMDKLAKTAAKLGTTTEELSKLRFAAKQTGVDARTLELGLQRMVRKIGDAAGGSKEAQKAFERLGLDFRELAELSPEQQFAAIAEGVSGLTNRTDQLSATVKIFDSEAAGLVNTLSQGPEAIKAYGDELERLGGVISSEAAAAAEQFNDNVERINESLKGLSITLGNAVLPQLTYWSELIASGSLNQAFATLVDDVSILPPNLRRVSAEISGIRQQIIDLQAGGGLLRFLTSEEERNEAIRSLRETLADLESERQKGLDRFVAQRKRAAELEAGAERSVSSQLTDYLAGELDRRTRTYEDYVKQLEELTNKEQDLLERIRQAGTETLEGPEAVKLGEELDPGDLFLRYQEALRQLSGGEVEQARTSILNITEAMDALREKGELDIITARTLRESLSELASEITRTGQQQVIDASVAQEQAQDVAANIEEQVRPQLKIELDPASLEQIKTNVEQAMQGFSVPVQIEPVVTAAGPVAGGLVPSTGSAGEPVYSDMSAAAGHRTP